MTDTLQQRFEEEISGLLRERNTTVLILGVFLFPLFVVEDLLLASDSFNDMLLLRLTSSLSCILLLAINRSLSSRHGPFVVTMIGLAALSLLKTFILPEVMSGVTVLYFVGHILIIIGALSFLPLSGIQAVLAGATCQVCYLLPLILLQRDPEPTAFVLQGGYTLCIWCMLSLSCHLNHQTRKREFMLRCKLYSTRQKADVYSIAHRAGSTLTGLQMR